MNHSATIAPSRPLSSEWIALRSKWGLAALLAGLLLVDLVATELLTDLHGGYNNAVVSHFASAFRALEGGLSFTGQEQMWPTAVLLYTGFYFFVFPLLLGGTALALALGSKSISPFRAFVMAVTVDYAVSLLCFILVPVPERWSVAGTNAILLSDKVATELIASIRPLSGLYSCFPSMHVSLTVVAVFFAYGRRMELRFTMAVLGVGIIASTLVLGVHWLPDIIAGLTTGLGAGAVGVLLERRFAPEFGFFALEPRNGDVRPPFVTATVQPTTRTTSVAAEPQWEYARHGDIAAHESAETLLNVRVPTANETASGTVTRGTSSNTRPAAGPGQSHPPGSSNFSGQREGDIFISYASSNRDQAQQLQRLLEDKGYIIWLDKKEIRGGEYFADKIAKALKRAKVVVVLLSLEAFESRHVKTEIHLANHHHKPLLPVLLGLDDHTAMGIMPDDMAYQLALRQFIKFDEIAADPEAILSALRQLEVLPSTGGRGELPEDRPRSAAAEGV